MFSREQLRELMRHMEWADARVWNAVGGAPSDERLLRLLAHVHVVQRTFLTIWTEGDVGQVLAMGERFRALEEVRDWARPYYPAVHALLDAIADDQLRKPVQLPWAAQIAAYLGHQPGATTFAETMFQVTSHSTYHRAQVNVRLRELEVTPPLVDYIAWLWSNRPDAEWAA